MGIDVCEEPIAALTGLARIPIVFEVERVIDVAERGDGFVLNRFAYRDFPDEVQLLWYKDLDQDVVREHTR